MNFVKYLRTLFLENTSERLLLDLHEDYHYLPDIISTTKVASSQIDYLMDIY